MKIAIIFFLLFPCLVFAQKTSKDKQPASDTLSTTLTDSENSIIKEYEDQYKSVTADAQRQQAVYQQQLKQIADAYRSILKMKVESLGGDSKKYFDVKIGKLFYIKK